MLGDLDSTLSWNTESLPDFVTLEKKINFGRIVHISPFFNWWCGNWNNILNGLILSSRMQWVDIAKMVELRSFFLSFGYFFLCPPYFVEDSFIWQNIALSIQFMISIVAFQLGYSACYVISFPSLKTNHHKPTEPESVWASLQFFPFVGLYVIASPLFLLGLLVWGWQWKHMAEVDDQIRRKMKYRILQLFGQNIKDSCLRLLKKIWRPGLHCRFRFLEGNNCSRGKIIMVRVGLFQGQTGCGH